MRNLGLVASALLMAAGAASAHLVNGSLKVGVGFPTATITAGSTVDVTWKQDVGHDGKYRIQFSSNGGTAYTNVEASKQMPTAAGDLTYSWTVPTEATTTARIRVCQISETPSCNQSPYFLESANFTITASSGVARQAALGRSGVRFDAGTGSVEVTLDLETAEHVTLEAIDARGKTVTLMDKMSEGGVVSVANTSLAAFQPRFFKLKIGKKGELVQAL